MGFKDLEKAKVHYAGVKFQQRAALSVHENVVPYEQDRVFFDFILNVSHSNHLEQL